MQDVFAHIDANANEYVERLRRLVRQPSVAAQGRGIKEALAIVTELAEGAGATVEHVPTSGNPVMWADFGGAGTQVVNLYNHYDVQPEDPVDLWLSDPFDVDLRDGVLYGRGVADDKGFLVGRLCAIDAWRQVRGELPLRLRMAAEGEEEIGSPHLGEFVTTWEARLREADVCVWEGSEKNLGGLVEIQLGGKGLLYVEFRAHGPGHDAHSMYGGILPNPAWALVRVLSRLVDEEGRVQIPGFYDDVREPDEALLELVDRLPFDEPEEMRAHEVARWARGLTGRPLVRELLLAPTSNIAGLHSGYGGEGAKTVLPAEAMLKMDFRLVPEQDPEKIAAALGKWLDDNGFGDIEVRTLAQQRPSRGRADHPALAALVEAGHQVGLTCVVSPNSAGTGPIYDMCDRLGLSMVTGESVARTDALIHAPNEHIMLDDYISGIKHFAAFLDVYSRS